MHSVAQGDSRATGHRAIVTSLAWLVVLMVSWTLIAVASYRSRDPDSTVYSEISGRLSRLPVAMWIAPDWGGSWGNSGLFREHPIGILVLPALLGRAGYPPEQAAFAMGALFSILSVWGVKKVISPLVRDHEAIAAQWAALILPIAFVYRIRANQEYPVLFFSLLALYATDRSRRSPIWIVVVVVAACALALVKGIFVIFLPVVCALWLIFIGGSERQETGRGDGAAWAGIAVAILAVAVLAMIYEWTYQRATGDSFVRFYLDNRIAENAGLAGERSFSIMPKLYNVAWYSVRVLWFAIPGSLILLASAGRLRSATPVERGAVGFAVFAATAYVGAMSLGANRADRFIFPAYFSVGVAGAIVGMRRWPRVDSLARRLAELPPYALPLAWLSLFILTFTTERRLPYIH